MITLKTILLMKPEYAAKLNEIVRSYDIELIYKIVLNNKELKECIQWKPDLILSFGSSVIVPQKLLHLPGTLSVNIHAASPEFPGRDPHHFAVYNDAKEYGATLHFMTKNVDEGGIIDVETFDVEKRSTPAALLKAANRAGWMLIHRLFRKLSEGEDIKADETRCWGETKTSRTDFLELCRITHDMDYDEVMRRKRAVAHPKYSNLYIEHFGIKFIIE
ncbi:formyltransferase family protein [Paracoccaceae bacterium]|nr:formyltransferase family protein [Paracoccaceae bacterium]